MKTGEIILIGTGVAGLIYYLSRSGASVLPAPATSIVKTPSPSGIAVITKKTAPAPVSAVTAAVNNTPVTQTQFVTVLTNVVDQVNSALNDIINPTPASPASVANADPSTKFTEALKWAKTAKLPVTRSSAGGAPTSVYIAVDGQILRYDLSGKLLTSTGDSYINRTQITGAGYVIF